MNWGEDFICEDLQGRHSELNHSSECRLYHNHRKVYILVKLIKCRIRKKIFFLRFDLMVSARKPSNAELTLFVKQSELPAFLLASTTKQTALCQSVADRLQKGVGLFRYSDWLTRKFILKLANWIFADLRYMRALKRRSIWNIKKASHPFSYWYPRNILAKFS